MHEQQVKKTTAGKLLIANLTGKCDMTTGHCNIGCLVGWTRAMFEKGYHLTINNTHKTSTY